MEECARPRLIEGASPHMAAISRFAPAEFPSYAICMPLIIGVVLAAIVAAFARLSGMDREKAFYSAVLLVVGHYYFLFALIGGGDASAIAVEVVIFGLFAAMAVAGFRGSMWFVAAGLAIHGIFDFVRHLFLPGQGVPTYWPAFCMAFDVVAAAVVGGMLISRSRTGEKVAE